VARLDEKGRCCGRKPIDYKGGGWNSPARPEKFCDRCDRSFDRATGEQVENWAWRKLPGGDFITTKSPRSPAARCQFCAYQGSGWINKDTCPRCKRSYDAILAQEGDD
jgi:hypothetical protein